jgi:hypothetical protein
VQAATLFFMGQPLLSASGAIHLFENSVLSPEMSQQISDWYTYSHVIHGFLFYLLLWFFFPKLHPAVRLLLALGIEIAWEITENTQWLIHHYREQALAVGYSGDSVLNSVCDSLAMMIGYLIAWRVPIVLTVVLGLALELFVAYSIHDNLTLNILGFIHHFDFINRWQSGV